jgi:hypothetical protein
MATSTSVRCDETVITWENSGASSVLVTRPAPLTTTDRQRRSGMADSQRTGKLPSNHRQSERILIRLVQNGEWDIDADGCIWRTCIRRGDRWGRGSRLIHCERRRVERRTIHGYLSVRAVIDGKRVTGFAQRLVWQHVCGDIPDGFVINHLNGIKDCNRPSNLEAVTYSRNAQHAYATGLSDEHGERNPAHKLTDNDVAQIRNAYASGLFTQQQLAERFNVRHQQVSRIVRGHCRRKQGGPIAVSDQRHNVCAKDPRTGRFVRQFPEVTRAV